VKQKIGFSKLSKSEKIDWLTANFPQNEESIELILKKYWNSDEDLQRLHEEFAENTVSNFYLPYSIAPNFLINKKWYCIPMVTEESSVVAAASKAANFWSDKGGFNAAILNTTKLGHVHFLWGGIDSIQLENLFLSTQSKFDSALENITHNMRKRGGGILSMELNNKTDHIPGYYQIAVKFDTCDSMGANFINTCLEKIADVWREEVNGSKLNPNLVEIVMSILSNYTEECLVRSEVVCSIEDLASDSGLDALQFAKRFVTAVQIAEMEVERAVTHNKGIMNGIDAVILATGNDFRAIEACAHAFACKNGKYSSLSHAEISEGQFRFYIEVPLALGTVGGITGLHPLVKLSHRLLNYPDAQDLMKITATVGLAQNFGAVRSLTTTGIQQGHMKMHLINIFNQIGVKPEERPFLQNYFEHKTPHYAEVLELYAKMVKR
jgi:hydroxymethylglutaryl-CoA reductase